MSFKFVEGVSLADVAFEARGKTLEEMLEAAANATTNAMVDDLKTINQKKKVKIKVDADDYERLLHNFLQEIIFYKDAKLLLFSGYEIKVEEKPKTGKLILRATLIGEKIDMKKHELLVDVKAVSWHMFKVEQLKTDWKCFVILDV
ncbi:MAG: archease [Candidatus Bilamarchaeum sp.]|jgi:SHS2 domain-containing protein